MHRLIPLVFLAVLSVSVQDAYAQDVDFNDRETQLSLISSGVLGTVLITSYTSRAGTESLNEDLEEEIEHYKKIVKLQRYLQDDTQDLWASLIVGSGHDLQELASVYGVPLDAKRRLALRRKRDAVRALMTKRESFDQASMLYFILLPIFPQERG